VEFLSDFLYTLVVVSITSGIVISLGSDKRGMDKFIKYAASLTILAVLLSPFAKVDFEGLSNDVSSFFEKYKDELGADFEEYKKRVSEQSAKALEAHTKSEIIKKTKLGENAFSVKFVLEYVGEDELDISEIKIELYTLTAVIYRDKMEEYILDKFGNIKYTFTERVN